MKKFFIHVLLISFFIAGCSSKESDESVGKNEVPVNNKGKVSASTENGVQKRKTDRSASDLIDQEMEEADEVGTIKRIEKKNTYVIDRATVEKLKQGDEEETIAYSDGEELQFVVTKETEVKVVFYDSKSLKSRIEKGGLGDLREGSSVNLFGKNSGDKFIATKVLVLQVD